MGSRTLSHEEARSFYDGFGKRQDAQAFYEDKAVSRLLANVDLAHASAVFEFGCGTGRFAREILSNHLPDDARYTGIDISSTMVSLARERTADFGERAQIRQSDGSSDFDIGAASVDRVLSTYVLDLLAEDEIEAVIEEARRVLMPGGLLGLVSLTHGFTLVSSIVMAGWAAVHYLSPSLVGGCRSVDVARLVEEPHWHVRHSERISAFGIPSEIVVAEKRS